jgi:hypothetical protein
VGTRVDAPLVQLMMSFQNDQLFIGVKASMNGCEFWISIASVT